MWVSVKRNVGRAIVVALILACSSIGGAFGQQPSDPDAIPGFTPEPGVTLTPEERDAVRAALEAEAAGEAEVCDGTYLADDEACVSRGMQVGEADGRSECIVIVISSIPPDAATFADLKFALKNRCRHAINVMYSYSRSKPQGGRWITLRPNEVTFDAMTFQEDVRTQVCPAPSFPDGANFRARDDESWKCLKQ